MISLEEYPSLLYLFYLVWKRSFSLLILELEVVSLWVCWAVRWARMHCSPPLFNLCLLLSCHMALRSNFSATIFNCCMFLWFILRRLAPFRPTWVSEKFVSTTKTKSFHRKLLHMFTRKQYIYGKVEKIWMHKNRYIHVGKRKRLAVRRIYVFCSHKVEKVGKLRLDDIRLQLLPPHLYQIEFGTFCAVDIFKIKSERIPFSIQSVLSFSVLRLVRLPSFSNGCVFLSFGNPYFLHEWTRCERVFCCYSHNSHYVAVFRGFFRLFRQFFL